jgi:mRNA interferase MazF
MEYLNEVTVAPITSTVRDIPSEVHLSREDGMPRECAVNCDHFQTVSKNKLGNVITTLVQSKMMEVQAAIRFALELEE